MPTTRSTGRPAWIVTTLVAVSHVLSPGALLAAAEAEPAPWSYESPTGPVEWGSLTPEYALCDSGLEQSPIDIPLDVPVLTEHVRFAYVPAAATVVDNGRAIQIDVADGGTVTVEGRTYALVQFHFHSPSEHTIGGRRTAMELHLVHADEAGALAVIGVPIIEGSENTALAPVWAALPSEPGVPVALPDPVDATALLPVDRAVAAYPGSLTTPPCTEGVAWHVFLDTISLSAEQVAAYRAIHDGTNRQIQPLGDRAFEEP